jgi:3-methylfumaryl-CoA hydratase
MDWQDWLGRTEEAADIAAAAPLHRLARLLDHETPPWRAGEVPPLGHFLFCLPDALSRDIGPDGHPRRGGFLPPVPLPRRMWAGSRIEFAAPVPLGAAIRRRSEIVSIEAKSGRSGALVFVAVRHEVFANSARALTETQDIVYREVVTSAPTPSTPATAREADWRRQIVPDPVLLFRFSALTFNAHRIHYDRDYCQDVEGYPGLVVPGALTATLLLDLFLRHHPAATIATFHFRGMAPLFDTAPFWLCGRATEGGATLWAETETGQIAMTAEVTVASSSPSPSMEEGRGGGDLSAKRTETS